jgi:predicted XRE-type DNA-binding protein
MIKTEHEYQESKKRYESEMQKIKDQQKKMRKAGLNKKQVQLALDPLASFALQLKDEIDEYESIKRGKFEILENLNGIGHTLIAIRVFKGISQTDLANLLEVSPSQVSRDERNEYHGASIEKIQEVLVALGATLKSRIENPYKDAV